MAQTAAERQSNYRRRQREQEARLRAYILTAFGYDFCGTCHCHQITHTKLGCANCDCKGFVRATEPKETER